MNKLLFLIPVFLLGFIPIYAVEIEHYGKSVTDPHTETTNSIWTDVPGAYITSGNFTTGDKYLIIVNAQQLCNGNNCNMELQLEHGTTDFTESHHSIEATDTDVWQTYTWFTVWTAIASEGIQLEMKHTQNDHTVDQVSLFVMNLDDGLTENTDWFYSYDDTDVIIPNVANTYVGGMSDLSAEIEFTPGAGNDWLVMGYNRIDENSDAVDWLTRLNSTGTFTEEQPLIKQEGEDTALDRWSHFLFRVFPALGATQQNFNMQSAQDSTTSGGTFTDSAIFALNLDSFVAHSYFWNEGAVVYAGTVYPGTEISTSEITTLISGDVFLFSQSIMDTSQGRPAQHRQTFDGNGDTTGNYDSPKTQTDDFYKLGEVWDGSDEIPVQIMALNNTDASTHTLSHNSTTGAAVFAEDRANVAFTMDIGGLSTPPTAPENLTAEAESNSQIDLDWDHNLNNSTSGFKIWRESPIGGGFATLIADTENTNVYYNNTGLDCETEYNYKVAAINVIGLSANSSAASDITSTCPIFNAITLSVNTAPFMFGSYSDSDRMACTSGRTGGTIFNTDDGVLNVCDGTNWTLTNGTVT